MPYDKYGKRKATPAEVLHARAEKSLEAWKRLRGIDAPEGQITPHKKHWVSSESSRKRPK